MSSMVRPSPSWLAAKGPKRGLLACLFAAAWAAVSGGSPSCQTMPAYTYNGSIASFSLALQGGSCYTTTATASTAATAQVSSPSQSLPASSSTTWTTSASTHDEDAVLDLGNQAQSIWLLPGALRFALPACLPA